MSESVGTASVRDVREWLEDKRRRGVERVRVSSVIARLDSALSTGVGKGARNGRVTVGPADLVGIYEASVLLNVDRTRPSKWREKGTTFGPEQITFPEPFAVLHGRTRNGDIPVFLRSEVERLRPFVEERRRTPKPDE